MADLTVAVDGANVPVYLAPAPDAVLDAAALAALAAKVSTADLASTTGATLVNKGQVSLDDLTPVGALNDGTFQATIDAIQARGERIAVPAKKITLGASLVIDQEDIAIVGASQKSSEIEANHDDAAISFTGQVIELPSCKFALSDIYITKATGNTLDANGFPQSSFVGTAVDLNAMFCGSVERLQVDRFGTGLDLSSVYQSTFTQFFARNCWMGLKCSTPVDGVSTGNTFIGGCFNNSAFDLTNGEKFTFIGVDFEASSTTCVISSRNIFQNCRFERMHTGRSFFTWLDIQGDFNKLIGSQFFWTSLTFVDNEETDFYVTVSGAHNQIEVQKIYTHRNLVQLESGSKANTVLFNAPFTDYANTGNNNSYRRSGRLFVDQGSRNRIVFENVDGRIEVTGTDNLTATGNLSNFLRYDALSNLTINASTLTIAQSDIAGPCGIPATHVDNKKFTIASTASTIRARSTTVATGDGTKVYSIGCFVYIPSGATQPTKVRIGDSSGVFTDVYPSDGTDMWHWVPVFTLPANGDAVQLMIQAEGDVGDVFYVALPSVSEGNIPAYVPVPPGKTSWTTKTTAKSVNVRDIQTLFGANEAGVSYTPIASGITGTVSVLKGVYTKTDDVVNVQIRLTGTSFSTASVGAGAVSLPFSGGDGWGMANNTDANTNIGLCTVLNGTVYLPVISATNSLQINCSYRMANIA